jgi:hypothetical protein
MKSILSEWSLVEGIYQYGDVTQFPDKLSDYKILKKDSDPQTQWCLSTGALCTRVKKWMWLSKSCYYLHNFVTYFTYFDWNHVSSKYFVHIRTTTVINRLLPEPVYSLQHFSVSRLNLGGFSNNTKLYLSVNSQYKGEANNNLYKRTWY